MNPDRLNKFLYIEKTPTWRVRILYLAGVISWILVVYGFSAAIIYDPFFRWFVGPIIAALTVYHFVSFGINILYKQFDLAAHFKLLKEYWDTSKESPSVDIFLPICGEDLNILHNTWEHVSRIEYPNFNVYVLDDSKNECAEHAELAQKYGFNYFERPNKGEMKKAGNLKYAFERTSGDFITIFDADFAPHPDFLHDLLPYMGDPKIGIVQSPQYFEATREIHRKTPLAYAAAFQEEIFYRVMQVAKDRLDAAICCGTNAIYRRKALETIGGPRQVDASEDSRTGFALLSKGWITRYVPIILAVGVCPDNAYAYFHQQHRWCRGRSELVLSKEFLRAPVPLLAKLSNVSGFLSFVVRPLSLLLSFQLFWTLFVYNEYISFHNSQYFFPFIIFSLIILPLFHLIRLRKEVFVASMIQVYATSHAIINVFLGKSVAWIATNSKHSSVSPAFRHTAIAAGVFLLVYVVLIAFAVKSHTLHIFNLNFYSVQFWIIWNVVLSVALLWQFYSAMENVQRNKISGSAMTLWKIKTFGIYVLLCTIAFWFIVFF